MTATYRFQMHAGFTFADAAATTPYLKDLGVTHLYLSPILQAAPGSMHGYDVLDHSRVSHDLGGRAGLERLAEQAHAHGLRIVVDVVPNHMAFVAPESANRPLWEVLRDGRRAATASWFDIDWDLGEGRLSVPFLGDDVEPLVASGEIVLDRHDGETVVRYHDHVFPVAPGTEGDDVLAVLERQHYRLTSWRDTSAVLNYRRFFDVTSLIAVRVEDPEVFEATHRVLLDLHRAGVVDGFRIDHPDGLADPTAYLRRLADACRPGTPIYVEKILEGTEPLPEEWPVAGTTGYDAMRAVSLALADPTTAPVLDREWAEAGGDTDLAAVEHEAKQLVVTELFQPEVRRLCTTALDAAPGLGGDRLKGAVEALLVAGEVYRAYRGSVREREVLDGAFSRARASRPELSEELDVLRRLVDSPDSDAAVEFAVRLQQTWGPVMAKGIEDTTFYRWHRLVALNEVGGDPGMLPKAGPDVLHSWARHQQQHWPGGMTTLSTHDTKRSEDVRARILAVAADPDSWERCSSAFREAADEAGVDRQTAHLLWQTLAGVGDIERQRLHDYLTKAMREAKQRSSWLDPDEDYEKLVLAFADQAAADDALRSLLHRAVQANLGRVRALTLGQKLLQLTMPGVPDVYQGCELVELSLVDPDNRRPVDYDLRRERLERLAAGHASRDLDDEKLLVVHRALQLRKRLPDAFGPESTYEPLPVVAEQPGPTAYVGFLRAGRVAALARLTEEPGGGVTLPEGTWRDELTGAEHDGGRLAAAAVFGTLPVALLVKEK